jgi:hypothetical protein
MDYLCSYSFDLLSSYACFIINHKETISAVLYQSSDKSIEEIVNYFKGFSNSSDTSTPGKQSGDVGLPLTPNSSVSASSRKDQKADGIAASSVASTSQTKSNVLVPQGGSIPCVRLVPGDIVKGGCVLSAAELNSSKEYIRNEDETFTTAFFVS